MKIHFFIGILAIGVCLGPLVLAQTRPVAPLQVKPPQVTKVAVLNISTVVRQDASIRKATIELWERHPVHKMKAEKLRQHIIGMLFSQDRDTNQKAVEIKRRELREIKRDLENQSDKKWTNFQAAWRRDFDKCIRACAEAYGFHIVLGYGSRTDRLPVGFPNSPFREGVWDMSFERAAGLTLDTKAANFAKAIDRGSAVPLHVGLGVDLTQSVIVSLARWQMDSLNKKTPDALKPALDPPAHPR